MRLHFQTVTEADLVCGPLEESEYEYVPENPDQDDAPRYVRVVSYENSDEVILAYSWDPLWLTFSIVAVPRSEVIQTLADFARGIAKISFIEAKSRNHKHYANWVPVADQDKAA